MTPPAGSSLGTPHSALRTGWDPWPFSIIALFSLATAGFAVFILFCNLHPTDLVAADYYEQEIHYQSQMDRLNRAQQLGGAATVIYHAATHTLLVSLPRAAAAGRPSGQIQLYRPSAARLDRQIKLELEADGTQTLDVRDLRPGLWRVCVAWKIGDQAYQIDQKIVVSPQPPVKKQASELLSPCPPSLVSCLLAPVS